MAHAGAMLESYPGQVRLNAAELSECIEACFDCAQTCTACADACLAERDIAMLVRCIRLNLDCADVCDTTGRLLSRHTETDWATVRHQVQACVAICRSCAQECERHAREMNMEHCRVCAEACRRCEKACERLLGSLPA